MGIKQYFRKQKMLFKARELTSSTSQLELILKIGSQHNHEHANFSPADITELKNQGYITASLKWEDFAKRVIVTMPETSQPIYIKLTSIGKVISRLNANFVPSFCICSRPKPREML